MMFWNEGSTHATSSNFKISLYTSAVLVIGKPLACVHDCSAKCNSVHDHQAMGGLYCQSVIKEMEKAVIK